MSADFQSIDTERMQSSIAGLFEQVIRVKGRIEFVSAASGQSCVLISKSELDSLEQALEILSNTEACQHMRDLIATVAARTEAEMAA